MKNSRKVAPNPLAEPAVLDDTPTAAPGIAKRVVPADPEVAEVARRRQFSPAEKRPILAAADACSKPGDIGALLRREGIYSSHLRTWRRQCDVGGQDAGLNHKRGRKADPAVVEAHRTAKLTREIDRLQRQLRQAQLIIGVQKNSQPC